MQKEKISVRAAFVAVGLLCAGTACAFDMGNMMNPSKWMGGDKDKDRYYDDYGPGYGYGGPGYGYGGPGYGYGGYPGYGYGGYGGYPGYGGYGGYGGYPGYGGYGGYPGYGTSSTVVVPGNGGSSEIEQLKDRIRQLEGEIR